MATYSTKRATGTTEAALLDRGQTGFIPLLIAYEAKSDKSDSKLKFYKGSASTTATSGASGQKVVACSSTSGFVAGDKVMIQFGATTTANEWHTIDTVQAGVSLTMLANLGTSITNGDKVFRMAQMAQKSVGAAEVSVYGSSYGILGGDKNMPFAAVLDGTAECAVDLCALVYVK
jgi:hypothetical protein